MKTSLIYILYTVIFILSCSLPQEPHLPQWQVAFEDIPLVAPDTLIIGQEFSDSSLFVDSDSLYHLWFAGSEKIELSQHLRLGPIQPDPISGIVEEVRVSGNAGQTVHVPLFEAFPDLSVLNNTSSTIPTQHIQITKSVLLDNYYSITLSEGRIGVTITNDLAFDLGQPITVTLYDRGAKAVISLLEFNNLIPAQGGQSQAFLDLAGKTITNDLDVIIDGTIAGTGDKEVYLVENQGFEVTVSMTDLVAVAAEARIPSQEFSTSHDLDLSTDSLIIASAELSAGSIRFEISSDFSFPVRLNMSLPGVLKEDRQSFNRVFDLLSGSSEEIVIDLAGRTVQMLNGSLQIDVITTLLPEADDYVRIHAGDSYRVAASVSELVFTNVTASVDLYTEFPHIEKEVMDTDVDVPEVLFNNAEFTLLFHNVPADLDLNLNLSAITGSNRDASAAYQLNIPGGAQRKVSINNAGVLVDGVPSGTGGGLMDIINLFPKRFTFNGYARIRDNYVTLNGAPIDMDYQLNVPFVFSVPEQTVLTGDTTKLDLSNDDKDRIRDINDMQLNCDVLNALGLGGVFRVRVADFETARRYDMQTWPVLTALNVHPAVTDANGNRIEQSTQQLSVSLDKEQISMLVNSDYLTWTLDLRPVPMARLKSTDYVIVEKIYLAGNMTIDTRGE